jgi:hypothetical protein
VSRQVRAPASVSNVELGWEKRAPEKPTAQPWAFTTQLIGRTRGDQVVCFDGPATLKGQILDIEITSAQNLTLFGKRVVESCVAS